MRRAEIAALAARWMSFWQGGALADFDSVHAAAFVDHSPAGRSGDRDGLRAGIEALYRAFPDFHAAAEFVAIDEIQGLATIRWTATGHQQGSFAETAPTGRLVTFEGIEIIRCRSGQVVERWGEWNGESIMRQVTAS